MALVQVSRERTPTATRLFVEDYPRERAVCRDGVWVGLGREFVERVVLRVEPWPLGAYPWMRWSVDGAGVWFGDHQVPPTVTPVPGHQSVTVEAGLLDIAFTGTPGQGEECFEVEAFYGHGPDVPDGFDTLQVCIAGRDVNWPNRNLDDEQECVEAKRDVLEKYEFIPPGRPWPPIERALGRLRGEGAVRIRAQIETLDRLDPDADKELLDAISAELRAFVASASLPEALPPREGEDSPEASKSR